MSGSTSDYDCFPVNPQKTCHGEFPEVPNDSILKDHMVWDIPCIARVMVRITLSGGVSNLSQRAGWNNF